MLYARQWRSAERRHPASGHSGCCSKGRAQVAACRAQSSKFHHAGGTSPPAWRRAAGLSLARPALEAGLLIGTALLAVVGGIGEEFCGLFGKAGLALHLQCVAEELIDTLAGGCLSLRPLDLSNDSRIERIRASLPELGSQGG